MYDSYFSEQCLIPAGRFCDVSFDRLQRKPETVIRSIYHVLGLDGFEELLPRLQAYISSISSYRKNRLDELPAPLRLRIAEEWKRSFEFWGYRR